MYMEPSALSDEKGVPSFSEVQTARGYPCFYQEQDADLIPFGECTLSSPSSIMTSALA